jgi:hypothetical protein
LKLQQLPSLHFSGPPSHHLCLIRYVHDPKIHNSNDPNNARKNPPGKKENIYTIFLDYWNV